MIAGARSSGENCFCRSETLVASALPGSQAELSFFSTPVSLPAIGPATARTTTQKPSTTHLVHRPHTSQATASPPVRRRPSLGGGRYIEKTAVRTFLYGRADSGSR